MTKRKARWGARLYVAALVAACGFGLYLLMTEVDWTHGSYRGFDLLPFTHVGDLGMLTLALFTWFVGCAVACYLVVELCVTTDYMWDVARDKPHGKWIHRYGTGPVERSHSPLGTRPAGPWDY